MERDGGDAEQARPTGSAGSVGARDDVILCVNNLSRFPQPVELDLRRFEGMIPVEMLGGVTFPRIGELPDLLTLSGYGFYWFRLVPSENPDEGQLL